MTIRTLILVSSVLALVSWPVRSESNGQNNGLAERVEGRIAEELKLLRGCQFSFGLLIAGTAAVGGVTWLATMGQRKDQTALVQKLDQLEIDYPVKKSAREKTATILETVLRFGWEKPARFDRTGEFLLGLQKVESDPQVRSLIAILLRKGEGTGSALLRAELHAKLDEIAGHPLHYQGAEKGTSVAQRMEQVEALAAAKSLSDRDIDLLRVQLVEATHRLALPNSTPDAAWPTEPEILADLLRRNVTLTDSEFNGLFPFVDVEPGAYTMGSPNDEVGRRDNEGHQPVTIPQPFALGKTEVTQKMWKAIMGRTPLEVRDEDDALPVTWVSWNDANHFAAAVTVLRRAKGEVYRLPREAEWEYAARGGQKVGAEQRQWPYPFGRDSSQIQEYAAVWDAKTSEDKRPPLSPAGSRKPNPLGLYDMHGSVNELCEDVYQPTTKNPGYAITPRGLPMRVIRGGWWLFKSDDARSASINSIEPDTRVEGVGLRLLREKP